MKILGVQIDNLTMAEALQRVEGFLADGQQHYIVTPNPEFLIKAQQDEEFRKILNQADLAIPDGIGLIFASWFLGQPLKERITGVDLMERICQKAAQKKWLVFLLGGKKGIAEKAANNLRKKYPGLEIEQISFGELENFDSVNLSLIEPDEILLTNKRPAVLFVALGASKQEKWIVQNLKKMPSVKLAMGVGGAFDFVAGRVRRAPKFLQQLGLEWFWRLCCQPWRIKRIFNAVIKFPWLVIKSAKKETR
jgi:N-acetylglucosaminyldiphosphoundecaprenol N-acetyl-beta-D-mannosaminyltransferase